MKPPSDQTIALAVLVVLVLLVLVPPILGWGVTGPGWCSYWPGT